MGSGNGAVNIEIDRISSDRCRRPRLDLVKDTDEDSRKRYINKAVPLYNLALSGKWNEAKPWLEGEEKKYLLRGAITTGGATVLHVAAAANRVYFVEKLVELMESDDLEIKDDNENTAFFLAAGVGNIRLAKVMLKKNENLPKIRGAENLTPLHFAVIHGRSIMAKFLFEKTFNSLEFQYPDSKILFLTGISAGMYDLAGKILDKYNEYSTELYNNLATARGKTDDTGLHILARKKLTKYGMKGTRGDLQLVQRLWNIILTTKKKDEIHEIINKPSPLLFDAVLIGNFEFLAMAIHIYPELIWENDNKDRSIIHFAVERRQTRIFNLIHEIGYKDFILSSVDMEKNTLLHLVAKLAPPDQLNLVSGAAFQLMLELIWFEKVKKIMAPFNVEAACNSEGLTPSEIFTEKHEELRKQAEKWMKDTAKSCMVVSTVISTGVFSAAFISPGGTNDNTGIPNDLKDPVFTVFSVSNAIALISSATSTLVFLSILISRYAESDFYKKLPLKLMCGLVTLFISIINMMVAFSSSLFITYSHGMNLVPILISVLAFLLIPLFVILQFSLWFDIFYSACYCKTLFRPNKAYALLGK